MNTITKHVHVQEQNNRFEGNRFHFTANALILFLQSIMKTVHLIKSANFFGVKRVKNVTYFTVYLFE